MKTWKVTYRPRGYNFGRNDAVIVYAASKRDARNEALMQIGDIYVIKKVEEIKEF